MICISQTWILCVYILIILYIIMYIICLHMYNMSKRWHLHGFVPFLETDFHEVLQDTTRQARPTRPPVILPLTQGTEVGRDWHNPPLGDQKTQSFPKILDTLELGTVISYTTFFSESLHIHYANPPRPLLLTISALSLQISGTSCGGNLFLEVEYIGRCVWWKKSG